MQAHPLSSPAARNDSFFPHSNPFESAEITAPPTRADVALSRLPTAEGPGLAHDAGNLLGALRLYCDLLEAPGVLSPEHRHYAAELRLVSERSSALLSRLLHLNPEPATGDAASGPSTHLPALHPNQVNGRSTPPNQSPAEALRDLAPLLIHLAEPYAQVTLEIAPHLPFVRLSAEAVERIAVNLVRNAAEAIHTAQLSGGHIHICLGMVGGRLRLSVEDNGPGMPPALAAAFLHPAPLPAGTSRGFGHRNVHELADATGGRLGIHVRPGRGTTLCLEWDLPVAHHPHHGHPAHHRSASAHLTLPPPIAHMAIRPTAPHLRRRLEGDHSV